MEENRMLSDEILLALIKKNSGGGGGTSDYENLSNQPQINGNTLIGNKTASDLGLVAAETGKGLSENNYTNEDKAIVGGVTEALADKQGVLTEGDYVSIDARNNISVNRELTPHQTSYRIKGTGQYTMNITKYIDGVQESSTDYRYSQGTTRTIDDAFTVNDAYDSSDGYIWQFVWLKDSTTHDKDYVVAYRAYNGDFDFTEVFDDEDLSGYKLVIKSEMDAALADKQDKSDNNLQTTDKTVVGGINELKSGLTNLDVALSVPENSGKNVLPYTLTSIKQNNSSGTWVDNAVTINGVTFTITASGDKVTKISATRVSASESIAILALVDYAAKTGEILSGCPSGGSNTAYKVYCRGGGTSDFGEGVTIAAGDVGVSRRYSIAVFSTSSPTDLEFYPMIRPATITDPTFAPYIPSVESRIEAVESDTTRLLVLATSVGGDLTPKNFNFVPTNPITLKQIGDTTQYENRPSGVGTYGTLIIFKTSSYIIQLWISIGMAHRFGFNNGESWSGWYVDRSAS